MTTRLTPHTITEAINFVVADNARQLGQIITDVKNPDHALYKQYHIARPRLSAAHDAAHNQLQGQLFMMLDHHKIVEQIKAAQQICQQEWQLHDFQIVALQRPGTKPPFHLERAGMETPVNEFTQNGISYIAADANNDGPSCRGCAFDYKPCLTIVPPCDKETRGDKEIIWQQSPNLEMKNND